MTRDASDMDQPRLRRAEAQDTQAVLRVERAAHALLAEHGVDLCALRVPEELDDAPQWTFALVAEIDDRLVGVVRLSEIDSDVLALDQVSVDPQYARRGIGRLLLTEAAATARELGYGALTGTTFRGVAFNAPFYATLGGEEDPDPHPTMVRRREVEQELGLDRLGARMIMRLVLDA